MPPCRLDRHGGNDGETGLEAPARQGSAEAVPTMASCRFGTQVVLDLGGEWVRTPRVGSRPDRCHPWQTGHSRPKPASPCAGGPILGACTPLAHSPNTQASRKSLIVSTLAPMTAPAPCSAARQVPAARGAKCLHWRVAASAARPSMPLGRRVRCDPERQGS